MKAVWQINLADIIAGKPMQSSVLRPLITHLFISYPSSNGVFICNLAVTFFWLTEMLSVLNINKNIDANAN